MTGIIYHPVHDIFPQTLTPAPKNTLPCIASALTPLSVCVTPFNAKLAQLTVDYSHSNPPSRGINTHPLQPWSPAAPTLRNPAPFLASMFEIHTCISAAPGAGLEAVCHRCESLSLSVFVHNSAVPGCRRPLTLAVSAPAAAAAAAGVWASPTWLQLAALTDRGERGPTCPLLLQGSANVFT